MAETSGKYHYGTRTKTNPVPRPAFRRLRGYAFDPSLSLQMETALVNQVIFKIAWEVGYTNSQNTYQGELSSEKDILERGPIGEYIEVIDYDPASGCFYEPVDLNNPYILAQDGLDPSEANPQFHQQMVYAVAMTTIQNFEKALGRWALWSARRFKNDKNQIQEEFVRRLRIYPHALREANAYYSPAKKALLFGYFPASMERNGSHFPGGIVFTCLSHDIIAHETCHALLDGMHRRYIEPTSPDALAFHEAFADIVALFQHFSFPEVLKHQIAKTRGDLASQNLLGELAQQFGKAIGHYGALRDAIGKFNKDKQQWEPLKPDPNQYLTVMEPHDRGAILVAAIFDAFLAIYKFRVADLFRIATGGSGILPDGALHPDLVNRLALEASKAAQHVLNMCIRALDYCPPIDINFGDYLRAIITADSDLVPDDDMGYRLAFIEAFRRRGIYPRDIRILSVESLRWQLVRERQDEVLNYYIFQVTEKLRGIMNEFNYATTREATYETTKSIAKRLHQTFVELFNDQSRKAVEELTGLDLSATNEEGRLTFEIHSVRPAQRVGPDGDALNQVIVSITQKKSVRFDEKPVSQENPEDYTFRGGCTLIFDLDNRSLRYAVIKNINNLERQRRQTKFITEGTGLSLRATYGLIRRNEEDEVEEPFALLHRD